MAENVPRPYGKHYATPASPSSERAMAIAPDEAPARVSSDGAGEREQVAARAEKSSNMMSLLIIISRITGFVRTTAQAWAVGLTGIASAYTVAATLPNLLYELVVGGMLVTAFLPVYVAVKKELGKRGAGEYASNLLSIVLMLMALLAVLSFVFAAPIIWTQSAGAVEGFDSNLAVWFFRWFVVEIILYAMSSVFSGVLNAERDYFWSNAAPILNNVITILSFSIYGYLVNAVGVPWHDAVIVLAVGNPLGVLVQVLVQVPALHRHGVRFRLKVNFRDPALRRTLSIGLPTLIVTFSSFPTTAVMSSCALSITEAGASIAYYSRVWYVLPYSIFAIPLSVSLFTELSDCRAHDDRAGFISCLSSGTAKTLFTLIPFAMFLVVFAPCLIAVFASGTFDELATAQTVGYLQATALSLPFYGLSTFLQKASSAMMRMRSFMISTVIASAVQVVLCLVFTPVFGLYLVPITSTFFYGIIDAVTLVGIRRELGAIGMRGVVVSVLRSLVFGLLGSLVGVGVLYALTMFVGPCEGALRGVLYAAAGGLPALVVTFGLASLLRMSDAPFFDAIFCRILRRS